MLSVFLVWETDEDGYESKVLKAFKEYNKAEEFITYRDKMTGCCYRIEEVPYVDEACSYTA